MTPEWQEHCDLPMPQDRDLEAAGTIWSHKPWWCQPWSILLTGTGVILASWIMLKLWWVTTLVGAAVSAWWLLFLVLVPRAWREALTQGDQGPGTGPTG